MPRFDLKIKEDTEYGTLGIIFNSGRKYFRPSTGLTLAHDILEHTITPHPFGCIDELLAIGSVLAGRIEHGWCHGGYKRIDTEWLSGDIYSLAQGAMLNEESLTPKACKSYLQDSGLMHEIKAFVRKGLIQHLMEEEDDVIKHKTSPELYYDIDSIVGWICKGYQLFRKRFPKNRYDISTYLFDKIKDVGDNWLKYAEEGQRAKLYVNFTTFDVRLEEEFM
jgi:hypothetical protein